MALHDQSVSKFSHLGSQQCIKDACLILDLTSNHELKFCFFSCFEGKALNTVYKYADQVNCKYILQNIFQQPEGKLIQMVVASAARSVILN